jgi:hypothetical protein
VVATKASDWFSADTQPLLVEYCQHCIKADEIAEALGKYPAVPEGNDDDFDRWSMLMDRKEKVAKVLAMLATKMRLCQQSRYTPQAASTSVRHTAQAEGKPWEGGQSDTG